MRDISSSKQPTWARSDDRSPPTIISITRQRAFWYLEKVKVTGTVEVEVKNHQQVTYVGVNVADEENNGSETRNKNPDPTHVTGLSIKPKTGGTMQLTRCKTKECRGKRDLGIRD
jgi:hypothetical protein